MLFDKGLRESIILSARAAALASATRAAVLGETSRLSTPVLDRLLPTARTTGEAAEFGAQNINTYQ